MLNLKSNIQHRLPGIAGPIPSASLDKVCSSYTLLYELSIHPRGFTVLFLCSIMYPMSNANNKSNLTLIEGGLLIEPDEAGGNFVMAEVTDTRLMGVLGIHAHRNTTESDFHQFFYIDTEEYGLDDYQSLIDPSPKDVAEKKSELFGGFGGSWVALTEKEYIYLVKHYGRLNTKNRLPFPEGINEYGAILNTNPEMTDDEELLLWGKICVSLKNDNELINYFIMRLVEQDFEATRFLSASQLDSTINFEAPGSLLKNEIKKSSDYDPAAVSNSYTCVSLIDIDREFMLIESNITLLGEKVTDFKSETPMPISPWEASLILNQPEYIIHASFEGEYSVFRDMMFDIFTAVTETAYDFGSLFMVFRKGNAHVRRKTYRLDQDTLGVVYLLDSGEIVMAGNDVVQLETLESSILAATSINDIYIRHLGNYKFPEPMLGRFVESDFESFGAFLEYLQSFQE